MTEDVLIIVGIVIGVIIFFELVVATVLCVKYTKKRYGWFNCNCCTCEYDAKPRNCCFNKKLHKYKIRKLSNQSVSSKSSSLNESIENRIDWNLPFKINSRQNNYNENNHKQIFTIETDLDQDKTTNNRIKVKNRMNSYLFAINSKNKTNEIEKENVYKKSDMQTNDYRFHVFDSIAKNLNTNDYDSNSTNLNTDSPLTDLTIPSPPSSLNLVSLSRCPSPPAPLAHSHQYLIRNDFASIASDETNQLKFDKIGSEVSQETFRHQFFPRNNNPNEKIENEATLKSSISFIRFYLDKFHTHSQQGGNNYQNSASYSRDYAANQNIKILNEYLSRSNTEEIIENTIELIKNFKPVN